MRRLVLTILIVLGTTLTQAGEMLQRPSLDALFKTREMSLSIPDETMWLPGGEDFIYKSSEEKGVFLMKENARTAEKERILPWSELMKELKSLRPAYMPPELGDVNTSSWSRFSAVLSPDGLSMAGVAFGDLYLVDLQKGAARFLTADPAEESFPEFSPDGRLIAFVKDGDLYCLTLETGVLCRLTQDGDPGRVLNGMADWLYQEELELDRAFFFSPDSKKILFLRFDDTPVGINPIATDAIPFARIEQQRYPTAGTPNPKVRLHIVDLAGGDQRLLNTGEGDQYLVRAGWTPDHRAWVQRLNRAQNRLDLLVSDPEIQRMHQLITLEDPCWINLSNDLRFLRDGRILWSSETTGRRHFELYSPEGKLIRRLDSGEWETDGIIGLDPDQKRVYFRANRGNRRQFHIWAMDIKSGEMQVFNGSAGGDHYGSLSPSGELIIDRWSSTETPPRADLLDSEGKLIRELWSTDEQLAQWDLLPIEARVIKADDGTELDGILMKPRDFDPLKKYPVVLYVYGGPHSQLTRDRWGGSIANTYRLFAEMGIATFLVDNRGTMGRGHAFETAVYRRLGEMEVQDQLAAARYLKGLSWVDSERIAVYGGSYGGYMTLMCLFKAPDMFRAGIAYAPVSDWSLYDTAYTERYMGTPQDNPEGYRESAPLNFAEELKGKLLLVHGAVDNNVHLQNSMQLIDRLASSDKVFELMIYPQTRHGVRHSRFAYHFHALKLDFLRRTLLE